MKENNTIQEQRKINPNTLDWKDGKEAKEWLRMTGKLIGLAAKRDIEQGLQSLDNEINQLKALNKELLEALQPFADLFDEIPESRVKRGEVIFAYNDKKITTVDFFRALAAITNARP